MEHLTVRWLDANDLPLCARMSAELERAVPFVLPVAAQELERAVRAGEVIGVFRDGKLSAFLRVTERPESGSHDTVEVRSIRSVTGGAREGLRFLFDESRFDGKRFAMVVLATNDKMISLLDDFGFKQVKAQAHDAALLECMQKDTGPRPAERLLFVRKTVVNQDNRHAGKRE